MERMTFGTIGPVESHLPLRRRPEFVISSPQILVEDPVIGRYETLAAAKRAARKHGFSVRWEDESRMFLIHRE